MSAEAILWACIYLMIALSVMGYTLTVETRRDNEENIAVGLLWPLFFAKFCVQLLIVSPLIVIKLARILVKGIVLFFTDWRL